MNDYVAKAKEITKYYHDTCALNRVDIAIKRGEIYGLVGDNGAGKSTFLKMLAGQIYPSSGELELFGQHMPQELTQARSRMGVLIENPGFYPQLTIEQNMEYNRIQRGVPGQNCVEEALEMTGLLEIRRKRCGELSLGMKQRLGLAIALLGVPEFLLLDEPINGLDPSGIIEMRNLILRLNEEKNITILISSHILSELEHIATVYGFLKNGYLLEEISAKELHKKCSDYIEILVSEPEQYAVLLEQQLHHEEYRILPDRKIHILHPDKTIDAYSQLASDAGLRVLGLTRCRQSLEEYYMNLKSGGIKTW